MLRLAVHVRREQAELVLAELLDLAPSGVEETDVGEDVVEYAIYGSPGELPALPELRAVAAGALVDVSTEQIADDFADRWRDFHQPLVLGDRLRVRPPWERPAEAAIDLVIDPGLAFGTGAHATTRTCLELMLDLKARGSFLDLGCGSGVLAIAAARLGFQPVLALDNDPASIEAAGANARANDVAITVRRHDLRTQPTPPARTVAANLLTPLLQQWATRLAGMASRPERVIAGGLLGEEAPQVAGAFAALGFAEVRRLSAGEWAALLLERPADA